MIRAISTGFFFILGSLLAQNESPQLTFDVASIKPSSGDERRVMIQFQLGGGLRTQGTTLKMLIREAYDVRDFQVSGGPGWINTDRFDVMAKVAGEAVPEGNPQDVFRNMSDNQRKTFQEKLRERLRALLADRCQLTIHRETKDQAVYALVVAKSGPKIKPSKEERPVPRLMNGRGQINAQGMEMQLLATSLSNQLGRPVIDRTGLTGHFDFELKWTPDPGQSAGLFGGSPPPGVDAPPPPDPNGPSIFTAVQEQLGLRLESSKGPVEMIVIDRVEKPSEN